MMDQPHSGIQGTMLVKTEKYKNDNEETITGQR